MTPLPMMLSQCRAWLGQGLVHHHEQMQRMVRAANAMALNMTPEMVKDFSQPYPGTSNNTIINLAGLAEALKAMENVTQAAQQNPPTTSVQTTVNSPQQAPTTTPNPIPTMAHRFVPPWLAALVTALFTALAAVGGSYFLFGRQTQQPAPITAPAPVHQGWRVRVNWVDENGKTQTRISPIEPIDGEKE